MQLNVEKSKMMIFKLMNNYQFSTNVAHNGNEMEVIEETKLLGTVITSDLIWHSKSSISLYICIYIYITFWSKNLNIYW